MLRALVAKVGLRVSMSQIEFVISWLSLAGNRMCCSIVQTNIGVTVAAAAMGPRLGKRLCIGGNRIKFVNAQSLGGALYSFRRELFAALSCRTKQHVRQIP